MDDYILEQSQIASNLNESETSEESLINEVTTTHLGISPESNDMDCQSYGIRAPKYSETCHQNKKGENKKRGMNKAGDCPLFAKKGDF